MRLSFLLLLGVICPFVKNELPAISSIVGPAPLFDTSVKTIHVRVALCDNKYQGIVPVPAKMGNGQDPANNLYWGWGYGVKTHFKKSGEWQLVSTRKEKYPVLERLVFRHRTENYYLVADAYDGQYMKDCIIDFLNGCAGKTSDTLHVGSKAIGINGNARLLSFIGHNGLMDFKLPETPANKDGKQRDCIILACASKPYFAAAIKKANASPILWTTNLMGPEAYTLHDALSVYVKKGSTILLREKAAAAYAKYTKCSLNAAKRLLVTGW
jgi:hypothetical protein